MLNARTRKHMGYSGPGDFWQGQIREWALSGSGADWSLGWVRMVG